MGYPPETRLKRKSPQNTKFRCQIVLKICTEHVSISVVLCIEFQNDSSTDVIEGQDLARFEFIHAMSFGRLFIIYIIQHSLRATEWRHIWFNSHYSDVIIGTMASQITSLTIVYSTVYSGADQRKHQSSASLVFVRGIHRSPVNSPHKGPVTRKMLPFDHVIMRIQIAKEKS